MGKLEVIKDGHQFDGPTIEVEGPFLTFRVHSEGEFLAAFEEKFTDVMGSEHDTVYLDIARSEGLADDAFRMIALNLFEIGNRGKTLVIRIPESLERFFRHANLYRVAEIEVVRLMGKSKSPQPATVNNDLHDQVMSRVMSEIGSSVGVHSSSGEWQTAASQTEGQATASALRMRFRETIRRTKSQVVSNVSDLPSLSEQATQVQGRLIDRRTGQVLDITRQETRIGRIPGNDVLIAMPLVSKRHAKIVVEDGVFILEDLGSANGTYVNGTRVAERKALVDGDLVQISITSQYPNGAKEYTFRL